MKNLAKVLTLILAVTFLATGCNLFNKEEVTSTTAEVVSADTVLDQQIYQRAIGSKDAKVCETITDKAVKAECGDVVDALVLTDKAVAELDDDFCGDIKLERYEDECEVRVASILGQKEAEEKKQEKITKYQEEKLSIEQKAIDEKDFSICASIEEVSDKYQCQYNVLANLAVSKKDINECTKIEDESLVTLCRENYDTAINR